MADDTTRIINLTEATEVSDGMYLVTDASTGTRKLSLQKVLDKAGGNVADDYDATATYDVGDLCVYKGVLYECSTEISTAEAWNPDHWSRINLGDIVADIDGSIEELYEDKANESGEYDDIVAGTAKQLLSSIYTTNDSPYLYRPTPADSDRERVKRIEGLSVGWNQLCNASSVTVTSGHKYYMKKASVESIGASDGTALTGLTSGTDMVIDLTLLFGSATIADHIYTLEQATAGSGVAWVKQYIDLDSYHAYSAPTIKSVEGLEAHVMRDADDNIIGNYPLDSTITLRGIPKLVDGKLVADGDWYEPSGAVSARYALDQMTYTYLSGLSSDYIGYVNNATYGNMIWVRNWNYQTAKARQSGGIGAICNVFPVFMNDTDFTSSQNRTFFAVGSIDTVEAFLTYVQNLENNGNGLFIVYELATSTTSTASPYAEVEICDGNGTEEFVTDSPVPVGNVTEYTADLRKQVENIYGIPPVPEEDGEYTLHATVAEGVKTFTWESES